MCQSDQKISIEIMVPLIFSVIFCLYVLHLLYRSMKRPYNFPPGPDFLPYMGNTIKLRKESKLLGGQHLVFEKWAKEHKTNILGLKLRNELVVVVLSYPLVHEVQIEEVFEGRPDNFFLRLRTMGTRKGITCTDGQLWYNHRNWAMRQMRSIGYGRSEMLKYIEAEAKSLLACIEAKNSEPVWPGSFLAPSVINVLWTIVDSGKRFDRDDKRLLRLLDLLNYRSKIFDMSGGVLAQFPWLRYIMPERTGFNIVQQLNQELYNFFMETIREHKHNLASNEIIETDLIYAYLSEMKSRSHEGSASSFNETQLIMTILDLFIAGSQTTSNTIDLALMMLALHEDLQHQLYEEIEMNRGEEEASKHISSRLSHPFVNSFLMEVQRFFHIVPISGPRRALQNTSLAGYDIPKNTTILISLRSVHMDEKHWRDPGFRPARFLDENGKLQNDEHFMPFGQGRRRCLGDALAKACLFSFIVEIIKKFKVKLCESDRPSLILQPGITLSAKPYKVRFIKRELPQK